MIEFKAECGHTVRAKDEDAGTAVRCSYCGRRAAVPDTQEDNLDFLFQDNDNDPTATTRGAPRKKSRNKLFGRRGKPRSFDPFALVLRMCYAALLIVIVIFVANRYIVPLFRDGGLAETVGSASKKSGRRGDNRTETSTDLITRRVGLTTKRSTSGLYIGSTPTQAKFWLIESSKAPNRGRINDIPGVTHGIANGACPRVSDGVYVVEVALPWNDRSLNDRRLPNHQKYLAFRRAIETASQEDRIRMVEDYFLPDEAYPVFVDQTDEQIYLVRQYRNISVRDGKSKGVRALFLPRIDRQDQGTFSIAPIVTDYLPKRKSYAFDEDHVRNELDYYDVATSDQTFILEALARIGIIPYITPDSRTRLFKIGVDDGAFTTKIVREAPE